MDKNGSAVVKNGMLTKTPKHFLDSSFVKSSLGKRGSLKLSYCACSLSKTSTEMRLLYVYIFCQKPKQEALDFV